MTDSDKNIVLHLLRERVNWCRRTAKYVHDFGKNGSRWIDGTIGGDSLYITTKEYLARLDRERRQVEGIIAELESGKDVPCRA